MPVQNLPCNVNYFQIDVFPCYQPAMYMCIPLDLCISPKTYLVKGFQLSISFVTSQSNQLQQKYFHMNVKKVSWNLMYQNKQQIAKIHVQVGCVLWKLKEPVDVIQGTQIFPRTAVGNHCSKPRSMLTEYFFSELIDTHG
jgi:hypothetical protein